MAAIIYHGEIAIGGVPMPELPEVETMRRGLLGIEGCKIQDVIFPCCRLRPISVAPSRGRFRKRLIGRTIRSIERLGKRVVLRLDNDYVVIFEPRMTGLMLVADPPNQEHLRVGLQLSGGEISEVWYWDRRGLGSVRLLSPRALAEQLGPRKLGPDALQISAEEIHERLGRSRRAIKVALLDQRAIAGIGNLYASEILHAAAVHPEKRCDLLTAPMCERIHQAMNEVLSKAIQYEGSTLGDGTYRNALNQDGGYQNHHRVYNREDETCLTCRRGRIVRIVQAQRSTFFCPKCQMKRPPRVRLAAR